MIDTAETRWETALRLLNTIIANQEAAAIKQEDVLARIAQLERAPKPNA